MGSDTEFADGRHIKLWQASVGRWKDSSAEVHDKNEAEVICGGYKHRAFLFAENKAKVRPKVVTMK
jgi:hypothetical protein